MGCKPGRGQGQSACPGAEGATWGVVSMTRQDQGPFPHLSFVGGTVFPKETENRAYGNCVFHF